MRFLAITVTTTLFLFFTACSSFNKDNLDTTINGFINKNCYQALIEIKPELNAQGLVEERESAYLKTKKSNIDKLALNNLITYCINSKLKQFNVSKDKQNLDMTKFSYYLKDKLKTFASRGKITFVYYNENNSAILGYRIHMYQLKDKIQTVIDSIELSMSK